MKRDLNVGDLVLVMFPYGDGQADKPHPALILEVDNHVVYLAYGTSGHIQQASNVLSAVTIIDPDDVAMAGLRKATAFHLDRRARVSKSKVHFKIGVLPQHKYPQLFRACVATGILKG